MNIFIKTLDMHKSQELDCVHIKVVKQLERTALVLIITITNKYKYEHYQTNGNCKIYTVEGRHGARRDSAATGF